MKRKILCAVLAVLVALPCCLMFNACGGGSSGWMEPKEFTKLELSYIENLKVDMSGKTGFSIKKVAYDKANINVKKSNSLVSFGNVVYADDAKQEKNMLFATTQAYSAGNVICTEDSIEKVTFIKNENVTGDVYDSNGKLISSGTKLTQEEIPGQINRMYTFKNFTFLQFVPLISESGSYNVHDEKDNWIASERVEIRPQTLTYDVNGVAEFDKKNYYSSYLSQSFVIDNNTGYIYKIENFVIENITDDGIITQKNYETSPMSTNYYKMYISDGKLVFMDIAPNKDLNLEGVVQDKYGWIFVHNNLLDYKDEQNKIVYFRRKTHLYMIDENRQVYEMQESRGNVGHGIESIIVDGAEQAVEKDTLVAFGLKEIATRVFININTYGFYKGYLISDFGMSAPKGDVAIEDSIYLKVRLPKASTYYWLDAKANVILVKSDDYVYYKVIDLDSVIGTSTVLTIDDFTKLSDEKLFKKSPTYIDVDGNKKEVANAYYTVTPTKTTYYQLVKNGDKVDLVELGDTNYNQNVFIFQPINR